MTLTKFLRVFFMPDEPIFIFGFSPKELPEELKEYPTKIQTSINDLRSNTQLQDRLKKVNQTQGLYFTVNLGGTEKADITSFNASFCEIDDIPIQDQHDLFDNAPYPPSIRVETRKSVHAYWLLSDDITKDEWLEIQHGLIDNFKSDKAIKNENRVMRLPFFNHVSFDLGEYIYKKVNVHTFTDTGFDYAELSEAYPHFETAKIIEPQKWAVEYENNDDDWQQLFRDMADKMRSLPGYHTEQGGKLSSAQGICHNGETNRTLVLSHRTGKLFCRADCTWDEIRKALGFELPKSEIKRYKIPRVEVKPQTSRLYQLVTGEI